MSPDNPACYECSEHKSKIHHWIKRDDGSAYCLKCNIEINKIHTDEVWTDHEKSQTTVS